jgi:hypothetical protein
LTSSTLSPARGPRPQGASFKLQYDPAHDERPEKPGGSEIFELTIHEVTSSTHRISPGAVLPVYHFVFRRPVESGEIAECANAAAGSVRNGVHGRAFIFAGDRRAHWPKRAYVVSLNP